MGEGTDAIKVTAAIIVEGEKVLIAQRGCHDKLALKWEFPGGKIDEGETPEECLKREINEELSLDIEVGRYFGSSYYRYEKGAIELLAYFARYTGGTLEVRVHSQVKWVTLDALLRYDFAPADIPLVRKLLKEGLPLC